MALAQKYPTAEDERALRRLAFQWAYAYDFKDSSLMRSICAPKVIVDHSQMMPGGPIHTFTPDEVVAFDLGPARIGHPSITTQHFLGEALFTLTGEGNDKANGKFQVIASMWWKVEEGGKEVTKAEMHEYGTCDVMYDRVDGEWKWAGYAPNKLLHVMGREEIMKNITEAMSKGDKFDTEGLE